MRVCNGGENLEAIANNARILHQAFNFLIAVSGDFACIKTIKRTAKILALFQNGVPTEPRLKRFKHQYLEQMRIIATGPPPLGIVILTIQIVLLTPCAPRGGYHLYLLYKLECGKFTERSPRRRLRRWW